MRSGYLWKNRTGLANLSLLAYIKYFRLCNWDVYVNGIEKLLVWFHAYDKVNYCRHFSYCFVFLLNFSKKHPEIYFKFKKGYLAVKRIFGNFNIAPSDQVIEEKINKDQKRVGVIIGFNKNVGCIQRWALSSHIIATWNYDFKQWIGIDKQEAQQKNLRKLLINPVLIQ